MSREEVQNIIVNYLKNYNPEFVGIFGSYARNQNIAQSDIDVLVSFKKPTPCLNSFIWRMSFLINLELKLT